MTNIKCEKGTELLCTAIIRMAVYDYMEGICTGKTNSHNYATAKAFLEGDDIRMFTKVSGRALMDMAEKICEDYGYNYFRVIHECRYFGAAIPEESEE